MISIIKPIALAAHLIGTPAFESAQPLNTNFEGATDGVLLVNEGDEELTLRDQIEAGLAEKLSFNFTISFDDANGRNWDSMTVFKATQDDIMQTAEGTVDSVALHGTTDDTEFTITLEPSSRLDTLDERYGLAGETEVSNTFTFNQLRELVIAEGVEADQITNDLLMTAALTYVTGEIIGDIAEKIENEADPSIRQFMIEHFLDIENSAPEKGLDDNSGPARSI